MKFFSLTVIFLVFISTSFSQEICDNGIDDDGDGNIDLNDLDCDCEGIEKTIVESIIPNSSFEDQDCCPSSEADMDCARGWIQASSATTDYFHECGKKGRGGAVNVDRPIPNGEGWVGVFAFAGNSEYAGACLTETMRAGATYTLNIWLAQGRADGDLVMDITIFGTTTCGELPFGDNWFKDCPVGQGNWQELGTKTVTFNAIGEWTQVTLSFVPSVDIEAVAIGGGCNPPVGGASNFLYMDDLQLNDSISSLIPLNISTTGSLCDGSLELQSTIDTIGWACQWYQDGIALIGETDETLDIAAYGQGEFTVRYTLDGNCSVTSYTVNGSSIDLTILESGGCSGNCGGEIRFTNITGGTPPYSYSIDNGVTMSLSPDFTGLCSGTYNLFFEDAGMCEGRETVTLADLSFTAGTEEATCLAICDGEIAFTADGGSPPYSYSADNGVTFNMTESLTDLCAGPHDLIVEDANGCQATTNAVIGTKALPPLQVTALSSQTICSGEMATISASGTGGSGIYNFSWNDGVNALNGDLQNVNPISTTMYEVTLTDECGTEDNDDVSITVEPVPVTSFTGDSLAGCAPISATFNNTTDPTLVGDCLWDFGDGATSTDCNPNHTFTNPGCYSVSLTVTSANGCVNSLTQTDMVCAFEVPEANFTFGPQPTDILNSEIKFANGSIGGDSRQWSFGDGNTSTSKNPTHKYPSKNPGTYQVTLVETNTRGCFNEVSTTITIKDALLMHVPNAFTPDGDEFNQTFQPVFSVNTLITDYHLTIFNRWGEKIFESFNPKYGWNGTYGDRGLVEDGTYTWTVEFIEEDKTNRQTVNGHVTVLK